jgi:hypothetical protein
MILILFESLYALDEVKKIILSDRLVIEIERDDIGELQIIRLQKSKASISNLTMYNDHYKKYHEAVTDSSRKKTIQFTIRTGI